MIKKIMAAAVLGFGILLSGGCVDAALTDTVLETLHSDKFLVTYTSFGITDEDPRVTANRKDAMQKLARELKIETPEISGPQITVTSSVQGAINGNAVGSISVGQGWVTVAKKEDTWLYMNEMWFPSQYDYYNYKFKKATGPLLSSYLLFDSDRFYEPPDDYLLWGSYTDQKQGVYDSKYVDSDLHTHFPKMRTLEKNTPDYQKAFKSKLKDNPEYWYPDDKKDDSWKELERIVGELSPNASGNTAVRFNGDGTQQIHGKTYQYEEYTAVAAEGSRGEIIRLYFDNGQLAALLHLGPDVTVTKSGESVPVAKFMVYRFRRFTGQPDDTIFEIPTQTKLEKWKNSSGGWWSW